MNLLAFNNQSSPNLSIALAYAARGVPVFPCRGGLGEDAKKPPDKFAWQRYKSTDVSTIIAWWNLWPHAICGLPVPPGYIVIDPDRHPGKPDGVAAWNALNVPYRATVRTPKGVHYWYKLPEGMKSRNTEGALPAGINVRGGGSGYVIAPGTMMQDGSRYTSEIDIFDTIELPASVRQLIETKAPGPDIDDTDYEWNGETILARDVQPPLPKEIIDRINQTEGIKSRSEHVMSVSNSVANLGHSRDKMLAILMCEENPISDHIFDQPYPERAAIRATRKAVWGEGWPEDPFGGTIPQLPPGASAEPILDGPPPLVLGPGNIPVCNDHNAWVYINWLMYDKPNVALDLSTDTIIMSDDDRHIIDSDYVNILVRLQRQAGMQKASVEMVRRATDKAARGRGFRPVQTYLQSLTWDGVERVPTWLCDLFGAERTPYVIEVGRMALVQAAARAMQPGCQADHMLILEGPQGIGKSSGLAALMPNDEYFSDNLPDIAKADRDLSIHMRGKWVIEIGELKASRKAEASQLKSFISRRVEKYRPPYGHSDVSEPRQCVFIGTTNEDEYLSDPTGNRRYHPVAVTKVDVPAIGRIRDQLWAEAVVRFNRGETWWPNAQQVATFKAEADKRTVTPATDDWLSSIRTYINAGPQPGQTISPNDRAWLWDGQKYHRQIITSHEIMSMVLMIPKERWNRQHQMRVAGIMKELGWHKSQIWLDGHVSRVFSYRPI